MLSRGKLYLDSETCGLYGMPVLLQYAVEDGDIVLYDVWHKPIGETLRLIEWFTEHTIVGFNLSFDWFHIVKLYTTFRLCPEDWIPIDHIDEIAMKEPEAQEGPCVKPASALDLMLHSRKGPYQGLMQRAPVRIRKIPVALAQPLAFELEKRVQMDGIYFARNRDPHAPRWKVYDRKSAKHGVDPLFKDVCLVFNPAGGLKFLAEHALGHKPKYHYQDVEPDPSWRPYELGFSPTALSCSSPEENWEVEVKTAKGSVTKYCWPAVIKKFVDHWANNVPAREYASDDVKYTRELDAHFGYPEPGDDDSILACMVPVVRWRGFEIDKEGVEKLREEAQDMLDACPISVTNPAQVRKYLMQFMDRTEACKHSLDTTTKKQTLSKITNWHLDEDEECTKCMETGEFEGTTCLRCGGTGILSCAVEKTDKCGNHPAAIQARYILDVKTKVKEVELYDKLLKAGKFHASFNVIGTLSSRMSGTDGLNAHGIKHDKRVRRMFPLKWDGFKLSGGDFDAFEVTIADAVYDDDDLRGALVNKHECGCLGDSECKLCGGHGYYRQKIHALLGMDLFPGHTYEQIIESDGAENDMYVKGKMGVFAMIYGGDASTLSKNLGIPLDVAEATYKAFTEKFPGIDDSRTSTRDKFCSMTQPRGEGTEVIWKTPHDEATSFLGFSRFFTLENKIGAVLFDLAQHPPAHWRKSSHIVQRRQGKDQTASGATSSALYGASFSLQAANMRAAINHEIQCPGGLITKAVQRAIYDIQPVGVHELVVAPMNVHDEIQTVTHPDYVDDVAEAVETSVESFRDKVPLIGMTWFKDCENWADKKEGESPLKICAEEMR